MTDPAPPDGDAASSGAPTEGAPPSGDAAPPSGDAPSSGAASGVDARAERRARLRKRMRWAVLGVVLLLTPLVAEVVLRVKALERAKSIDHNSWHVVDPMLGWKQKPGFEGTVKLAPELPDTYRVKINAQGWRGETPYAAKKAPGKKRIVFVGDSFTFGAGCDGESTVTANLQRELGEGVEVLNLGTCAYGVDQMRLVVEHHALGYEPDLILVGVILPNFRRALRTVSILGHRKPRFVLRGDELELTNVPVPAPPEEGSLYLSEEPPGGGSFLLWKLGVALDRLRVKASGDDEGSRPRWKLGSALLRDSARIAEAKGVPLAIVLYPTNRNLLRGEPLRPLLAELGLPFCDTYPHVEAAGTPAEIQETLFLADGHPSPKGQAVLSKAIADFVRAKGFLED